METLIRDGRSDAEIYAFMTERYGDFILLRPPVAPRTWLLWAAPALFLAGGLAVVLVVVRRRARIARSDPAALEEDRTARDGIRRDRALFLAAAIGLLAWPLLGLGVAGAGAPRARIAAAVVARALPAAAFLIYLKASNWDWGAAAAPPAAAPDLQRVVDQLQEKLAKQPEDVDGWKLLGRSATVLGNFRSRATPSAKPTRARRDAMPRPPSAMPSRSCWSTSARSTGMRRELFDQALALAPDNPRALWYGGIAAYRRGDMALARNAGSSCRTTTCRRAAAGARGAACGARATAR